MRSKLRLCAVAAGLLFLASLTPIAEGAITAPQTYLPNLTLGNTEAVPNAKKPPADLATLAQVIKKSIVSISCGKSLISGWSLSMTPSQQMMAHNFTSYIVTNYGGLSDCLSGQTISVKDSNGTLHKGMIWSFDPNNNLISIAVEGSIPGLNFATKDPEIDSWIGLMQALPDNQIFLTNGILTIYSQATHKGETIAVAYPERSGGPAFDRLGQVVGTANIYPTGQKTSVTIQGTLTHCDVIVRCQEFMKSHTYLASVALVNSVKSMLTVLNTKTNELMVRYKKVPKKVAVLKKIKAALPTVPDLGKAMDPVSSAVAFANEVNLVWKTFDLQFPGVISKK